MTVTKRAGLMRLGQVYFEKLKSLIEANSFAIRAARAFADIELIYSQLPTFEEGTWTIALGGTTSSSGMVYTQNTGLYVRQGNFVTAFYDLQLSTLGTITGDAVIEGLPFPAADDMAYMQGYWDQMTTAILTMPARIVTAESRIRLYQLNAAATVSYGTPLVQADFANTSRLIGSVTYPI